MSATPARRLWSVAWRLAVCVLLLAWIFHSIFHQEAQNILSQQGRALHDLPSGEQYQLIWSLGPRQLWRTISLVGVPHLAAALALFGVTIVLGVVRWRLVLRAQGLDLSLWRAAEISLIAQFFNAFLLGSTGGDLMKAYYAARETHHQKTEAVTTVFADRLIGLFCMLVFAVAMMLPNRELLTSDPRLVAVAWLVVAMALACAVMVVLAFWGGVSRGVPRAREFLRRLPKGEHLERSLESCRRFGRNWGLLGQSFLLSMLLNLACVWIIVALARGLGMGVPDAAFYVVVPMVICLAALPVTPSGLGVRENLFVMMLTVPVVGEDATKALSLSLLAYAAGMVWSVAGGLVYLGLRRRHHLDEFTRGNGAGTGPS